MRHMLAVALFVVLGLSAMPLYADQTDTKNEGLLPNLTLTVPDNAEHRNYLGLKGEPGDSFTFNDIDADVLLIELFSMYCPFCQQEAPLVNKLYEAMNDISRPDLKVKIIGLGAKNSEFEVDHFRKTFQVNFPLFPDPELFLYNTLKGKGTPFFIGCKKNGDNSFTVVLRQAGGFHQSEDFLHELLKKSKMN